MSRYSDLDHETLKPEPVPGRGRTSYNSCFSTAGPVCASALNWPGGANSLGPAAPRPKSRCVSPVGPEAPQRFTKTHPLHASPE